jgi:hypothetical protein
MLPIGFKFLACFALVAAILSAFVMGCGGGGGRRLKANTTPQCPWVAPNRQAEAAYVHVRDHGWGGGGTGYNVWIDESNAEHKIEHVQERVWAYMEKTGVAASIKAAETNGQLSTRAAIVSIKPTIALLVPCPPYGPRNPYKGRHGADEVGFGISVSYHDGMQWCSPDLKQRPTEIKFSDKGVAEIVLPTGKLRLVRESRRCSVARE